jgi:hypothetical protein
MRLESDIPGSHEKNDGAPCGGAGERARASRRRAWWDACACDGRVRLNPNDDFHRASAISREVHPSLRWLAGAGLAGSRLARVSLCLAP